MSQSHHHAQTQEQRIQPVNISTSDYVYQLHRPPPADPPAQAVNTFSNIHPATAQPLQHHSYSDDDEEVEMRRLDARRREAAARDAAETDYRSERCCKECCGRRQRFCWFVVFIVLALLAGIVAGFIIAGQQSNLEQQCPLEWSRVNVMGEDSSFASKLPPSKWLYVFSGTSIGELLLFCGFVVAMGNTSGFQGLPMVCCFGIPLILMLVFKFAWATTGLVLVSQSKFCSDTNDTAKYMIMIAAVWTYVQLFLGCPLFVVIVDG